MTGRINFKLQRSNTLRIYETSASDVKSDFISTKQVGKTASLLHHTSDVTPLWGLPSKLVGLFEPSIASNVMWRTRIGGEQPPKKDSQFRELLIEFISWKCICMPISDIFKTTIAMKKATAKKMQIRTCV